MLAPSLHIPVRSTKNRMPMRLRRLREPRYRIGAMIGAADVLRVYFRPRRAVGRRDRGRGLPVEAAFGDAGLASGSARLLLMAALAWILPAAAPPHSGGARDRRAARARDTGVPDVVV